MKGRLPLALFACLSASAVSAEAQDVEIRASGCYSLEKESATVKVSATSSADVDLSDLKYCLCDRAGRVIATYKADVGRRRAKLLVNLPSAGDYTIRTTDGTNFHGSAAFHVLRRNNPHESEELAAKFAADHAPKPKPSGIQRAWYDFRNFDQDRLAERQKRLAREAALADWNVSSVCSFAVPVSDADAGVSDLVDGIDRAAAQMKREGKTTFAYPDAWKLRLGEGKAKASHAVPDCLTAWYAKFDVEGLFLMPVVNVDSPYRAKMRKAVAGLVEDLVEQGMGHPSFKGVCLRVADSGKAADKDVADLTDFCVKQARKFAEKRSDLRFWIDGASSGLDAARLEKEAPNVILERSTDSVRALRGL